MLNNTQNKFKDFRGRGMLLSNKSSSFYLFAMFQRTFWSQDLEKSRCWITENISHFNCFDNFGQLSN